MDSLLPMVTMGLISLKTFLCSVQVSQSVVCPSVLAYLDLFCAEISRHAVERRSVLIPIWDQAYHNMILRQDPSDLKLMPWHSQLATVGEVPSECLSVHPDGQIMVDGDVPAILHQYDLPS